MFMRNVVSTQKKPGFDAGTCAPRGVSGRASTAIARTRQLIGELLRIQFLIDAVHDSLVVRFVPCHLSQTLRSSRMFERSGEIYAPFGKFGLANRHAHDRIIATGVKI
jgi:hypothetical protein